jgi:hypothetical protein
MRGVRVMFVLYALGIAGGLAYAVVVGIQGY